MKKHFFIMMTAIAMLFCACNGNDPTDPGNSNTSENHSQEGCMYVGITGFNNDLYHFTSNPNRRFEILDRNSLNQYTNFVSRLSMDVNTALYWAVENNVNHLASSTFPQDISNVSIVTFTDGLDNGSSTFDNKYFDPEKDAENQTNLHNLIKSTKVSGINLTAYTVGVKGHDVGDADAFAKTLKMLADVDEHSYNIGMSELNQTFQAIANDLYKQNVKPQLTVAFPPKGRKYRLVFDNVGTALNDGSKSQLYIEGQLNADLTLSNVVYKNCVSESGDKLSGNKNAKGQFEFTFENFVKTNGDKMPSTGLTLWWLNTSTSEWNHESEFNNAADVKTEDIRKSAAVMLILDCSKSLEKDNHFAELKKAAVNFLEILASGNGGSGDNPGGGEDPQPDTKYYIKHPWGTGQDAAWAWKQMTKEGNNYVYSDYWGGVGANINTTASDAGAEWFAQSQISGASSLSIGDGVKFTYKPSNGTLSVTKTSGGSGNTTQVRFRKEQAYERVLAMSVGQEVGGEWNTLAIYEFGTSAGTTSYSAITSGSLYPTYYYSADTDEDSGWYFAFDDPYTYNFVAGKKYTFNCGDDGTYFVFSVILDGSANAPAKVIASKRILKSELTKQVKVRK